MRRGDADPAEGFISSFLNVDSIEHLGAFLRSLEPWYRLRDCERLVEEAIKRLNWKFCTKVPVLHCEFALEDVRDVLKNSKLKPRPYSNVYRKVLKTKTKLKHASKIKSKSMMNSVLKELRKLRDDIAKVSEPS